MRILSLVFLVAITVLSQSLADESSQAKGHKVLGADKGKVAIVSPQGKVEWEVPNRSQVHDITRLANGNIMFQSGPATVVEVAPDKSTVWSYTSKPKAPYSGPIEVHAFQRLDSGLTMIAETGNKRLIEVDRDGKIAREIALQIDNPHPHRDTRLARKLPNGHYLVCHEADGVVREYDGDGKVVWSYALDLAGRPPKSGHDGHGTEVFGALRKPNGNTLIATGNGNRVIEVNPNHEIVWSVNHDDLPGIRLFWVTSLQLLPNGNIVFGNCHAGPDNPQLIEVTPDKKVAWTFKNHEIFGNDLAAATVIE